MGKRELLCLSTELNEAMNERNEKMNEMNEMNEPFFGQVILFKTQKQKQLESFQHEDD